MEEKIKLISEIFEVDLRQEDLSRKVTDVLIWDSFHIMNYLMEVEEQFQKRITVEQISEVGYVYELLQLMESGSDGKEGLL